MLARLTAARRLPQLVSVRFASDARTEGSVAKSPQFSKKEKAHEDQYVRQHEQAQLEKLRAEIQKKKNEIDDLEKQHNELEKKL